jgi:hypothetical protein
LLIWQVVDNFSYEQSIMNQSQRILFYYHSIHRYFSKLEQESSATEVLTAATEVLAENNDNVAVAQPPMLQGGGITSPIAAQTLLGMSQISTSMVQPHQPQHQKRGPKRKLSLGKTSKSKSSQCCQFRNCKNRTHKQTRACFRHQPMLCSYPHCGDLVEEDKRFKQKRELCKMHYMALTQRPRGVVTTKHESI